MRIQEENKEKILLEDGGRFYALYLIYDRKLKIIDSKTDRSKVIEDDITPDEAFDILDQLKEEDIAKKFQQSQETLFFMDGETA